MTGLWERYTNRTVAICRHGSSLIGAIGVFVLTVTFAGCGSDEVDAPAVLRPVQFEQVFQSGGERTRTFVGVAEASMQAELSFKVGGTISDIKVARGDTVAANQLIATLDPQNLQLVVQEAAAALSQAEAQQRRANADYERVRGLYETRNASKQDLDAARAASESASAQLAAADKRLEIAELQVTYCSLRAPVAGAITAVPAEVNENTRAGEPIAVLTSGDAIEVDIAVPEALIGGIREGDPATVTFDALGDREFTARVIEVAVASSGMATTFPATVQLTNTVSDIRPGMAAEVAFTFAQQESSGSFLVPAHAVGQDRSGRFVFVVMPFDSADNVGVVVRRPVSIGELRSDGLEVRRGLIDGDYLVTVGVHRLVDSQRVRFSPGGSASQ